MNRLLRNTVLLVLTLALCIAIMGTATAQKQGRKNNRQTTRKGDAPISRQTAMLAKLLFTYRELDSLSQKVHGKMIVHMAGANFNVEFDSSVIAAQPNKFQIVSKVSFLGAEKHGTVYSDGKKVWDWDSDAKQYSEQPQDAVFNKMVDFTHWVMDREGMDMSLLFFLKAANDDSLGIPNGLEKAQLSKLLDIKNYPTRLVDGTPMYLVPVPTGEDGKMKAGESVTLYVDTKEFLVRRLQMKTKFGDDSKPDEKGTVEFVVTYDSIKKNPNPKDDLFTFVPPADAKQMDDVKPVFNRIFNN